MAVNSAHASQAQILTSPTLWRGNDWLLKNADARKAARNHEIDGLGNAKAVLSGADYSFVQTKTVRSLRH